MKIIIIIIIIIIVILTITMMMMTIMMAEKNYVEDTIILDYRWQYQMITMKKDYFAGTTVPKHHLTAKTNYFVIQWPQNTFVLRHTTFSTFATKKTRYRKRSRWQLSITTAKPHSWSSKNRFWGPITNLIDKANNVIEIIPKNEKEDLDKYDLHLSEQLSKLFLEIEDVDSNYLDQNDDQTINELPIAELTEVLSKVDKGEVPKQLKFFEGDQNQKFENKVKLIGLSTASIEFLNFLQSSFCQEVLVENKLKIHIEYENIFL